MRIDSMNRQLLTGVLLAFAAQSAIADGLTTRCSSISGGKSKVSSEIESGCKQCSVKDTALAADGKAASFASIQVFSLYGASIRATAQPGVVYPAGGRAGVFYSVPDNNPNGDNIDSGGAWGFEIATYLAGQVQEQSAALDDTDRLPDGDKTHANRFSYIDTSKPYDAVEIYVSDAQARATKKGVVTLGSAPYKVYEICSDGAVE